MTNKQYSDLWNKDFAGLSKEPMPNYEEFLISERMLEDYLDIFRGENSREGHLKMPYPHPFFDEKGKSLLNKKPCIKFILIGEARPKLKPSKLNTCKPISGDIKNTFFYNITHVNPRQPWLSAPRLNWDCPSFTPCPSDKINTLLCLARNGVLLLDLFPFAISYSAFRAALNSQGITRSYWDDLSNPYSLINRMKRISSLFCEDWDLTLIAPCIISEHIVNPQNGFPTVSVCPFGLHPITFRDILHDETRCISCKVGHQWRKIAISQQAPTRHLIHLSF